MKRAMDGIEGEHGRRELRKSRNEAQAIGRRQNGQNKEFVANSGPFELGVVTYEWEARTPRRGAVLAAFPFSKCQPFENRMWP